MSKLIAKCGMDCGTCPWGPYARANLTPAEFEQYRKNAKKILGYTPMQKPCATCQTPDKEIPKGSKLPPRNCLVRQCVAQIGVLNCAYCSRFPCEGVENTGGSWNRKRFEEKLGAPISDEDYHAFIEPFEGLPRLEAIRASLKTGEIKEAAKVPPLKTKILDYPKNLPFSREERASLEAVHELLSTIKRSSLGLTDTDTLAQQPRLKSRMAHLLRFLWILGLFGELKKENGSYLVVDAKTYEANRGSEKTLAIWSFVKDSVFKILSEFGVHCERVALKGVKEEDLTTGTEYLRSKGWVMKMSFEERAGGAAALEALQTYAKRLNKKYGKKAFQYFSDVDMRVLSED